MNCMVVGRVFVSVLLFMAFSATGSVLAGEETLPLDRLTFDEWYGIYMQGKKVGYAHMSTGPVEQDGEQVFQALTKIEISAQIESMKMNIEHRSRIHFSVEAPWRRIRANEEVDMAGAKTTYQEEFKNGKYTVITTSPSGTQKHVTERPTASLKDHFATELACLRSVKQGYKGECLSWDVETLREEKKTFEFLRVENRLTNGVMSAFGHVREIGEDGDASEILYEMASGRILKWSMGPLFTMRLEPKETALDRSLIRDYVLNSNHRVDRRLGFNDPGLVEQCRLFLPGLISSDVKNSPRMKVIEQKDGVEVLISDGSVTASLEKTPVLTHLLEATPGIQSEHEEIVSQARRIVGQETSARAKAEQIVHWVYKNLKKSRLFDTDALTVLRKMEGDCSEHSILSVALARAVGIPAEKAGGMMYAGDKQGVFVAHAWVRFYLDGAWVEMDPTWDQVKVDATHLSLTNTGVSKLQGQKIKVLDASGAVGLELRRCPEDSCRKLADSDSWTHCPDCSAKLSELPAGQRWSFQEEFVLVGRMYRNRKFGFQIETPGPKWSFISDPKLVQSHSKLVTVILHSPDKRYAMVRVENLPGASLEEYAGRIKPRGKNPTKLGQEKISLHGHDAIRVQWKALLKEEEMHFSYAVVQDGDLFYQVICWCSASDGPEAARAEFDAIQNSFWIRGRPKPQ